MNIGNVDLIEKRGSRTVPIYPGGVLNDYVPFYFTPFSPMALNIKTGYNVPKRPHDEILILVSSFSQLVASGLSAIFTDRHAYLATAQYFANPAYLSQIDWTILQARDFSRDPQNPEKMDRYQAETLVHRRVPLSALLGIIVHSESVRVQVQASIHSAGVPLQAVARPGLYFR